MIVYVRYQGSHLTRKGRTIRVMKERDCLKTIFIHRTRTLVLLGSISLTPPVINLLCSEKVNTYFMTQNGRFKGMLYFDDGKNVYLRKMQFDSLSIPGFTEKTVVMLVKGKIHNREEGSNG